jgi:hypothetical protein
MADQKPTDPAHKPVDPAHPGRVIPPLVKGDPRGIGPTLAPDCSVETERREIERGVYERRSKDSPDQSGKPQ